MFMHFSEEPDKVRALIPVGLEVDTFPNADGVERAWIGLVPFRMEGIRPRGFPALPWLSAFPETNVRTYVHREGSKPGVWFFSLDAARWLACKYARVAFKLPYYHATMRTSRIANALKYESHRMEAPRCDLRVTAEIGESLLSPRFGSLEFFLVERYLLYSLRNGQLFTGMVHHTPYPLRSASLVSCGESIVAAAGIEPRPWQHVCFSDGVDVEVFGIEPCPRYPNERNR